MSTEGPRRPRADLAPRAIEQRLHELARLSAIELGRPPRPRVDMSARAVEARLAECAELSSVCLTLARSGGAR